MYMHYFKVKGKTPYLSIETIFVYDLMKIALDKTKFSKINSIFGTSEVRSFSYAVIFDM